MPLRATAAACDSSHLSPAAAAPAASSASAAARGCSCRMQNHPVCHHRHRQDKSICPRDKTSLAGCGRLCASPRPPLAKWMRKHRRGDPATAFFCRSNALSCARQLCVSRSKSGSSAAALRYPRRRNSRNIFAARRFAPRSSAMVSASLCQHKITLTAAARIIPSLLAAQVRRRNGCMTHRRLHCSPPPGSNASSTNARYVQS